MGDHSWRVVFPEVVYERAGGGHFEAAGEAYQECSACGMKTRLVHPPRVACAGAPAGDGYERWLTIGRGLAMVVHLAEDTPGQGGGRGA